MCTAEFFIVGGSGQQYYADGIDRIDLLPQVGQIGDARIPRYGNSDIGISVTDPSTPKTPLRARRCQWRKRGPKPNPARAKDPEPFIISLNHERRPHTNGDEYTRGLYLWV